MNDSVGRLPAKTGDMSYAKTNTPSYLKWLLLLATGVLTPIIASLPGFEYWHLAPLWGRWRAYDHHNLAAYLRDHNHSGG